MKKFVYLLVFLLIGFSGQTQPPCGSNPAAGNTCATATPICELNGYCGNTSSSYTANSWSQSCGFLGLSDCGLSGEFCGSIENNSFLTFVASSSSISFDVWVFNSTYGDGIQIMIFSATNCSGTVTSYYCDELAPSAGSQNVSASGLTPGNTYYIMIDGFAGDVCDYIFAANTGVSIPVDVNPATASICGGDQVVLTATGGNGTYTWNASPNLSGTTGSTVTATPPSTPGTYTYTVNSATGNPLCPSSATATATITVTSCGGCTVTAGNSGDVCQGTATFDLTATNVAGATWAWTGPGGFTSTDQNPMNVPVPAAAGSYTYTVTATDAGVPCTSTTTIVVNPSPVINAPTTNLCIGATTTLTSPDTPDPAAPWVSSNPAAATITSGGLVTGVSAGTTTITYTTSSGCSQTQTITVLAPPVANAGADLSLCVNATTGNQLGQAPVAGNSYLWTPGTGLSDATIANPTCTASTSGTTNYTLTVTIAGGCTSTDNVSVTVLPNPTVSFLSDVTTGCNPQTITFTNTSPGSSNCVWNFQGYPSQNGCGSVTNLYDTPGTFDVGLTITDANGCTNSLTNVGMITIFPRPDADFSVSPTEASLMDPHFEFTNSSTDALIYFWTFGDGTSSNVTNPTHTYIQAPGSYQVMLYANSGPCIDSAWVTIGVKDELIYYVPNTFTPDGDEHNNVFLPIFNQGFDIQSYTMLIFNRWGEVLFETHNLDVGWDGYYKTQLCKEGDYVYKIVIKHQRADNRIEVIGHFTLLK